LKHYGAEAFFGLLAFDAAAGFTRDRRTRQLVRLCLVLTLGLAFANSQLFVAPPLFAALLLDAVLEHRDWRRARTLVIAGAVVMLFDLAWLELLIAPRLSAALTEYWAQAYVPTAPGDAVPFVVDALWRLVEPTWGSFGLGLTLPALIVATAIVHELRVT